MIWKQTYHVLGLGTAASFLLASLPILTLLVLLGVLRKPAWLAGLAGLAVTFALAILGYRMPAPTALSAATYGAAFALFPISWIIFWAIALFQVTAESGQFAVIRQSIGQLTADPRLQALLIAFTFGGFLEGAAGFGTPVAIAATMLVGLGFSPFRASAICLLANTTPVAFGSIGIPIFTLAGTTGLPVARLSAATGALCAPTTLLLPLYLVLAIGGMRSMSGIWLPVLSAGAVFGLAQFTVSTWLGPQLADIVASLATMLALVALLGQRRNAARADAIAPPGNAPASLLARFRSGDREDDYLTATTFSPATTPTIDAPSNAPSPTTDHTPRAILRAWSPYALLVACVSLWSSSPLQAAMNRLTLVIRWPWLHAVVLRVPPVVRTSAPYPALYTLNWLSAAGTACMVATLISATYLGIRPRQFLRILIAVLRQLRLPTLTVVAVLATAFLMNYCGATATLGLGFASTGRLFPIFSALLGWVGVFLTGSDTSSNALFGNLQVVTAGRLALDPVLMAATNSAGGVMGKMISLQTIAIAAAATGLTAADQVRLFRFTLRHSLLLACVAGGVALAYSYLFHFS